MRQQQKRQQRAGDGAGGVHRLQKAIGGTQAGRGHRVGQHHVASSAADALGEAIGKANAEYLPPRTGKRQQRLYGVGDKISGDYDRLAALHTVGKISRKQLGKRGHALGDALDDTQLCGSGADRCQECR